jgi:hypothetical protein
MFASRCPTLLTPGGLTAACADTTGVVGLVNESSIAASRGEYASSLDPVPAENDASWIEADD